MNAENNKLIKLILLDLLIFLIYHIYIFYLFVPKTLSLIRWDYEIVFLWFYNYYFVFLSIIN